jgi:hypothetical protein
LQGRRRSRAANNCATVARIKAIFGRTGEKTPSLYSPSADRTRLAREAMATLAGKGAGAPISAPASKAPKLGAEL